MSTEMLKWDDTGTRIYETGTDRGVLYPIDTTGAYPRGVAWNGLTGVTEKPTGGDETALYANNAKYASLRAAEEFAGTINAYTYPDEFTACDGSATIAKGVTVSQQNHQKFGLSYRTILGNDVAADAFGYKLHLVYGATTAPSEREYATVNDKPDAITFSWDFTTDKIALTGHKPVASLTIDSTKADPAKLAALEAILYGSATAAARLPLPAEVITLMTAS